MISFLQANLHCGKSAQDLMYQMVARNNIDFIIASEFKKLGGANWYTDISGKGTVISISGNHVNNTGENERGFR